MTERFPSDDLRLSKSVWMSKRKHSAFTLVELLVVIAITITLVGLLIPCVGHAMEKAKVTNVHADLRSVGIALTMYFAEHEKYPPMRVNCNTDLSSHYFQLPQELPDEAYLPPGPGKGMAAHMEDVFNRGHTYKYQTPGDLIFNGRLQENMKHSLKVPKDFPTCLSREYDRYDDFRRSPVQWVVYSLGPKPDSRKTRDTLAPMYANTWYTHTGDEGVIVRMGSRYLGEFKSP